MSMRVVDIKNTYEISLVGILLYMLGDVSNIHVIRMTGLSFIVAVLLIRYGILKAMDKALSKGLQETRET